MKPTILPLLWLVFFCLPVFAHAQKFQFFGTDSTMSHTKGHKHYISTLEYYQSENNDKPITITQLNTELSYYVLDRVALGGSLLLAIPRGSRFIGFEEHKANTFGGGMASFLRIDLVNFEGHGFYADIGYGMLFTLDEFPPGGTHYNFSTRYGLGYTIHLSDQRYLQFGWRWMHISNGKGLVPANPAFDGNGLYLAYKFAK